ncbi:MAG: hypothetical protein Q4D25_04440 [Bacteroidales bacterium]|nr:hypothetical protein [Bacteroidales bacterium]
MKKNNIILIITLISFFVYSCESKNSQFKNVGNTNQVDKQPDVSINRTQNDITSLMKSVEGRRTWRFSGVECFLNITYTEEERILNIILEADALNIDDSPEKKNALKQMFLLWMKQEQAALAEIIDASAKREIEIVVIAMKSSKEQLKVLLDANEIDAIQNEEKDEKQVARDWLQSMSAAALLFNPNPENTPQLVGNNLVYNVIWTDTDNRLKDIGDKKEFKDVYKESIVENAESDNEEKYFLYQLFKVCVEAKVNVQYHLHEISSGATSDVIFVQSEMKKYIDDNQTWMTNYFLNTMQK